ncbi:DUF58 domain-containing protein [Candidatus Uabimicrobium sp. HlEnr_7]|uniref:DUF58 domain-containing protein n=1 Tax=Candidatus Uabimicrobium helgolandensis TaxID=3095367 RepID=UPI0035588C8A
MEAKELIKKVHRIQIITNRMVNEILAGEYHSAFKGKGMEFDEVREYQVGDDIRNIDWNVTARTGTPYVKRFSEERELTIYFLVDISPSQGFGTKNRTKAQLAVEIAAILSFAAIKNNDKIGLILFSDTVEKFLPPRKGRHAVMRIIREMLSTTAKGTGTDVAMALEYLGRVQRRKAVVFLISDFISTSYEKSIKQAQSKYDVIAITSNDPGEFSFPEIGIVELEDAETGERIIVDGQSPLLKEIFSQRTTKIKKEREALFKRISMDELSVSTNEDYLKNIHQLFRKRATGRKK